MQTITLANVLCDVPDFLEGHADLYYRANEPATIETDGTAIFEGEVSFLTYFNALPMAKWRRYAALSNVKLELDIAGPCSVHLMRVYAEGVGEQAVPRVVSPAKPAATIESNDFSHVAINMSVDTSVLASFHIVADGPWRLKQASFTTTVDDSRVRPVRIALCTTTFNNEQYILPNIKLLKEQVLASDTPIAHNLHMFVVDNGRTLKPEDVNSEHITLCPNPNVGGSGGFARGMMEALKSDQNFTHVLLMDDDVHFSPESFNRTYSLLSLACGDYADAFVSGAMLKLQEPNIQFEDVSQARPGGGYDRYKPDFDVSQLTDLVRSEVMNVEGPSSYAAWWYCVIPMKAVREHGLPLPLFVRGDDVEYGVRCQPTFMCMAGICVWHSAFFGRFKASIDCYQYQRNLMIMMAADDWGSLDEFMIRFHRNFHICLRFMDYETADLWLQSLEDYLRGPVWLATIDGAKLAKENAKRNEKLVPISELDPKIMNQVGINTDWISHEGPKRGMFSKSLEMLPYDHHLFPDALLSDKPGVVLHSGSQSPWTETAMRTTLVALDSTGEHGHIRHMDRKRYWELLDRYHVLLADYAKRGKEVAEQYRYAFPYLTSVEFWEKYLDAHS